MKTILFIFFIAFNGTLMASNLGKETYELTCKRCHAPKFSIGMHAPAAFDRKAWAIRFQKATMESKNNPSQFKTAMEYLLYRASIGKGLMPHGGLCKETDLSHKNCTYRAITEAIYYMAGIPSDN